MTCSGARVRGQRSAVVEAAILGRDLEVTVDDRLRVVRQAETVRSVAGDVVRLLARLVLADAGVVDDRGQLDLVILEDRVGQVVELGQAGEQAGELRRVLVEQAVDLGARTGRSTIRRRSFSARKLRITFEVSVAVSQSVPICCFCGDHRLRRGLQVVRSWRTGRAQTLLYSVATWPSLLRSATNWFRWCGLKLFR